MDVNSHHLHLYLLLYLLHFLLLVLLSLLFPLPLELFIDFFNFLKFLFGQFIWRENFWGFYQVCGEEMSPRRRNRFFIITHLRTETPILFRHRVLQVFINFLNFLKNLLKIFLIKFRSFKVIEHINDKISY